jgi:PiT family inorganic phosphate transporter
MPSGLLIGVLVAAFCFELINGFHDTANAIAPMVFTRALTAFQAIALCAVMNFVGALTNESVAETIAKGIVNVDVDLVVILAALLGATLWDVFTWWRCIPTSSSHALIGGLIGATMAYTGTVQTVRWDGVLQKVIIPLFTSPLMGILLGFLGMRLVFELFANWTPHHANAFFSKMQILSSAFMAYEHGSNDAQKTMGIITLALVTVGQLDASAGVPLWVKLFCAGTMMLGTAVGGKRIMGTVGEGVTKLEPASGFVAETSSALAIAVMTAFGAPVSTTQVVTASVMGAGSAHRPGAVRWGTVGGIVKSWFVTLPTTIALGAVIEIVVRLLV